MSLGKSLLALRTSSTSFEMTSDAVCNPDNSMSDTRLEKRLSQSVQMILMQACRCGRECSVEITESFVTGTRMLLSSLPARDLLKMPRSAASLKICSCHLTN